MIGQAQEALNWSKHSQQALLAISEVNERKDHTESLVREFVVTGEEGLAVRAETSLADIGRSTSQARQLLGDNAEQARRLDRLNRSLAALADQFTRTLIARRKLGTGAATQLIADGSARQLADEAESILDEMTEGERRLFAARTARAERFSVIAPLAMRGCGGLTLLFGLLAWRALRQESKARALADAQKVEAESQFRALMENAPDAIFINQNGHIVFTNPACVRLLGLSGSNALLGRTPFEFVRADFHETVRERIRELEAGKAVGAVEQVYVRADGTEVPVEVTASPVTYNGQPAIHASVRDVTERKRAAEALRLSERRYRLLFESIDEGFCIIEMIYDAQGKPADYAFLELSPSFEKQSGLQNARGRRIRELAPTIEEHWIQNLGRVADTGEAVRFQNRAEALHRWFDVYAFRFGEPASRQVGFLFSDITARKEALAALQESEENLAVTLQSIGDAVLATDVEGRITRLNAVAEKLTGWSQTEAPGRPVEEVFRIIHEGTRHPAPLPIAAALATGTVQGLANHTVIIAKDGTECPIADSCSPIRSREGKIIGAVLVFRDMSQERAAEQRQRAGELLLRSVLDSMQANMAVLDCHGEIISVNEAWESFARANGPGVALQGVNVGANYLAVCERATLNLGAEAELILAGLRGVLARTQPVFTHEYPCHSPEEQRWFVMHATPLARAEGGAVVTHINTTQRKLAEIALRASEESLAVTLQSIGDGVLATDQNGRIKWLNAVAANLTGWTQGEAIGRPVAEVLRILNEETGQPAFLPVAETLAKGTTQGLANHTLLLARDGTRRPIADSCAPIRSRDGSVIGAVLVFRDVTLERAAEIELRRSRAVFQNLFESLPGAFLVLKPDLTIAAVSNRYLEAVMLRREQLLGRGLFEVFPDNPDEPGATGVSNLRASLNRVRQSGVPDTMAIQKYDVRRPDGTFEERYWSPINSPVFGPDHALEYIIHRVEDVTEFVRQKSRPTENNTDLRTRLEQMEAKIFLNSRELESANRQLYTANVELARASKLKDEFLANMSHELRTPLNAILGLSETLLEQISGPLTPKQIKSVTTISTSGQHLLALINDILDLSKIEAGKLELRIETILTRDFCQGCLVFVQAQAMQKQIRVACDISPGLREFQADPKRFKQVLVNLLTNAVKFTPPNGHIGLTVAVPTDEAVIHFTVWDTGIGIATADQGKLFQAFTQVDSGLNRTQEGTGLGLALVARLVELHSGSVTLTSEPGKGSRFTVTLPWQPPPAPGTSTQNLEGVRMQPSASGGATGTAAPVAHQFHRALVIEDDPTAAEQLVHYLNSLGLSSEVHSRGEEVIASVMRDRPDIILLDLLLPSEDGWQVLARLKEHPQTRAIPVAVVSVVDEPEKSIALGAAAHFIKPVSRDQLAAFLRRPLPRPAPPRHQSGSMRLCSRPNHPAG